MAGEQGAGGNGKENVQAFTYPTARRKNIPPAGLAAHGRIAERAPERYAYNPHLPSVLRFDADGKVDRYAELLEKARRESLTQLQRFP